MTVFRPLAILLATIAILALGGCYDPYGPRNEKVAYVRAHPDDWEAQLDLAQEDHRIGDVDGEAERLQQAMRTLAPDWQRDSESRVRYVDVEDRFIMLLGVTYPPLRPAERLAVVARSVADRQLLSPEETAKLGTGWEGWHHYVRGKALAELGDPAQVDLATADLVIARRLSPGSYEDGVTFLDGLKLAVDMQTAAAARAQAAGDQERATRCLLLAKEIDADRTGELARRHAIDSSMEQQERDRSAALRAEGVAWQAGLEARQKADRERAADQVACPACHGQGGFTVDHVQRQAGADGNVRETSVGTSSMTCPYCQNGLVSKARAEEIAQEMR